MRHSPFVLLVVTSLLTSAACGELEPQGETVPLLTLRGHLTAESGPTPTGDVRVALLWIGDAFMAGDGYEGAGYNVAADVPVEAKFPAAFTLEIHEPAPAMAMRTIRQTALGELETFGLVSWEGDPTRLAFAGIVAYEDLDGDGELDLVPTADGEAVDRIVAATKDLAVFYFEDGVLDLPHIEIPGILEVGQEGAFDLGYNLAKVPTCALESNRRVCPGIIEALPIETEIELPLEPNAELSNLMCQSYETGYVERDVVVEEPFDWMASEEAWECSYDGAEIRIELGCETVETVCSATQVCSWRVHRFPDDEAGRLEWPCLRRNTCELSKWVPEHKACPAGYDRTNASQPSLCWPVDCQWEPWCHADAAVNVCPTEGTQTHATTRQWTVGGNHLYWVEEELGLESCAVMEWGKECVTPVTSSTIKRRPVAGGDAEAWLTLDGQIQLGGATPTELFWTPVQQVGPGEEWIEPEPHVVESLCWAPLADGTPTCAGPLAANLIGGMRGLSLSHHLAFEVDSDQGFYRFDTSLPLQHYDLYASSFTAAGQGERQLLVAGAYPINHRFTLDDRGGHVMWIDAAIDEADPKLVVKRVSYSGGEVGTLATIPVPWDLTALNPEDPEMGGEGGGGSRVNAFFQRVTGTEAILFAQPAFGMVQEGLPATLLIAIDLTTGATAPLTPPGDDGYLFDDYVRIDGGWLWATEGGYGAPCHINRVDDASRPSGDLIAVVPGFGVRQLTVAGDRVFFTNEVGEDTLLQSVPMP